MAKANQHAVLLLEEDPASEQVEQPIAIKAPEGHTLIMRGGFRNLRGFAADVRGFIEMGILWSLVAAVVTALILLMALNLMAPDLFVAVADLTHTLRTATLNSTLAEGIAEVVGLILPVAFILAFVAVPFAAFETLRRVRGGSRRGY